VNAMDLTRARHHRWSCATVAGVAALVAVAGTARGQEDARTTAQKKMAQGNQLMEQGQPAEALRLFRDAYKLVPNPRYQYNIAVACQATGRDAEALEAFQFFLAKAEGVAQGYTDDAKKQIEVLRGRVAQVTVSAKQSGAGVLVDGRDVGNTPLPQALVLDPGEHRFLVRKLEFEPFEHVVNLRPGDQVTVTVELRPIPRPVAPAVVTITTPTPPPPAAEERSQFYKRWWFWTAVGAVVVTGVIVGVAASSRPGGPKCPGGETICVEP
jgi:PEGA domain